jgi:hypothetical protein
LRTIERLIMMSGYLYNWLRAGKLEQKMVKYLPSSRIGYFNRIWYKSNAMETNGDGHDKMHFFV